MKKMFNSFLLFCDYLLFDEDLLHYINKFEILSPEDNFVPSLIDFGLQVLKKNFRVFLLFRNYIPLEKGYPLPLSKFESPSPKDNLLAQWFWRRFLNDPGAGLRHFYIFVIISPLKRTVLFYKRTYD